MLTLKISAPIELFISHLSPIKPFLSYLCQNLLLQGPTRACLTWRCSTSRPSCGRRAISLRVSSYTQVSAHFIGEFRIEIETKTGRGPRSRPPPPSSGPCCLPRYRSRLLEVLYMAVGVVVKYIKFDCLRFFREVHGGGCGNENFGFAKKKVFEREWAWESVCSIQRDIGW